MSAFPYNPLLLASYVRRSSTLENWCREFQKFVGDNIHVETYYADKNERPKLREMLNNSVATKKAGGWNVLITTYQLANGDDHDRKFFKRIDWDVSTAIIYSLVTLSF